MFSFILICKHASWHKSKMPLSTLLIFNPMPVCSVFQFLLEGINNSSLNKFRSQLFTSHQALHSLRAFPSVKWQIKTIRGKGNRRKLVSPYVIACQFLPPFHPTNWLAFSTGNIFFLPPLYNTMWAYQTPGPQNKIIFKICSGPGPCWKASLVLCFYGAHSRCPCPAGKPT